MKAEVYFQIEADDPDIVLRVMEVLTVGLKKVFKNKKAIVGTPKGEKPKNAVIVAPLNITLVNEPTVHGPTTPGHPDFLTGSGL